MVKEGGRLVSGGVIVDEVLEELAGWLPVDSDGDCLRLSPRFS